MSLISVETVRESYIEHKVSEAWDPPTDASVKGAGDEFDAWVAALKAEVRRETLDEARANLKDEASTVNRESQYREGFADGLSSASDFLLITTKKA